MIVTGNGMLGRFVAPSCGGESTTSTISFQQLEVGIQLLKLVVGTTIQYHLETSLNGGSKEEASLTSEDALTFESTKKLECT